MAVGQKTAALMVRQRVVVPLWLRVLVEPMVVEGRWMVVELVVLLLAQLLLELLTAMKLELVWVLSMGALQ